MFEHFRQEWPAISHAQDSGYARRRLIAAKSVEWPFEYFADLRTGPLDRDCPVTRSWGRAVLEVDRGPLANRGSGLPRRIWRLPAAGDGMLLCNKLPGPCHGEPTQFLARPVKRTLRIQEEPIRRTRYQKVGRQQPRPRSEP